VSGTSPTAAERSRLLPRMATLYQAMQRDRVGLERSLATKGDLHEPDAQWCYEQLQQIELRLVGYLRRQVEASPVWPWLSGVKGIGPRLGGMLIGLIDIQRADSVSALWRFCGYAVIDGKAERRVKGEKLHYNAMLHKTCYLISRQFLLARTTPYIDIYADAKVYYTTHRPDWTPLHRDLAARRKMVKIFLAHLWNEWRAAEGLPIRLPYAQTLPGHAGGYIPSSVNDPVLRQLSQPAHLGGVPDLELPPPDDTPDSVLDRDEEPEA
jgi:hypothetical protein